MTTGLMRRFSTSARTQHPRSSSTCLSTRRLLGLKQYQRHLTDVRPRQASVGAARSWFTSSPLRAHELDEREQKRLRERHVKLGNTISVLHDSLPNLLNSPLPSDILSPNISLHLFPSTHPHLPAVSGRLAYTAALWTAPVAWGRVPVIGNVKLKILSERLVQNNSPEKLIVKWQTCSKADKNNTTESSSSSSSGGGSSSRHVSETFESVTNIVRRAGRGDEFTGLFLFEFDELGRVSRHTIEHMEEGRDWEAASTFVSVTDWLLGRAWGRARGEETPSLAFARCGRRGGRERGRGGEVR